MKRSTKQILTTHPGSLPQPQDVFDMLAAKSKGQPVDHEKLAIRIRQAVADIVKKQQEVGITVPNDGEQSKSSWSAYVPERLTGFTGQNMGRPVTQESGEFPDHFARTPAAGGSRPSANGPITWKDFSAVTTDIDNMKTALKAAGIDEGFVSACSPGHISNSHPNDFFKTEEEYLHAAAEAMSREYEAIAKSGLIVQIDSPDIAIKGNYWPGSSVEDFRKVVTMRVEALNYATRNISPEQMRIHVCWGRTENVRIYDARIKDYLDLYLKARPLAMSFPSANGRHEHEWKAWKDAKVPAGKFLMPGVIDNTNPIIEHPETVADRLERFASVLGRENIAGGVNCGFGNLPAGQPVETRVAWAKMKALGDGAIIASKELWRK